MFDLLELMLNLCDDCKNFEERTSERLHRNVLGGGLIKTPRADHLP
jgi:hypothetical protein